MKQMTIRSMDQDLEAAIEEMCRQRQWSVNQVATYLMRKGLGLTTEAAPQPIGSRLDSFWGAWTKEEVRSFDAVVDQAFGQIDEESWK
ncbi:MAG: hypothetical protein HC904_09205 [Blastochloris sp.]|nr:hypothetical protein [Blastochloris sp.]